MPIEQKNALNQFAQGTDVSISDSEGFERDPTEIWLTNQELSQFVQILKSNKLDIFTLLECTRDELFKIFEGVGLKPHQNVRLRSAITNDKRWKGGFDFVALKETTYAEVQEISKKLSESSATLSKVEDAKWGVDKACNEYLAAINDSVEEIRAEAHAEILKVRDANENTIKNLHRAQQDIWATAKRIPVHNHNEREKNITSILGSIADKLNESLGFIFELYAPKPDLSPLKISIDSLFTHRRRNIWDYNCKSSAIRIVANGLGITVPRSTNGKAQNLGIRGLIGWTTGIHS